MYHQDKEGESKEGDVSKEDESHEGKVIKEPEVVVINEIQSQNVDMVRSSWNRDNIFERVGKWIYNCIVGVWWSH